MRIIVTGSNGFVGQEIVTTLSNYGHEVIKLGRKNKNLSANFIESDITEPETLKKVENLEDIDVVIHSAGLAHQFGNIDESAFEKVNYEGTVNILQTALKLNVKHFILLSSTAVYGIKKPDEGLIIDENFECKPETFYAASKLKAEKKCIEICELHNLPLTVLRLAPVLGENNTGNAARLVEAIDNNRFIWVGKGTNLKTLVYKKDVAEAVAVIVQNKRRGSEIFNLAGEPVSMQFFVNEIEKNLKKKSPKIYIPVAILKLFFNINKITVRNSRLNRISGTLEKWLSNDVYTAEKISRFYSFKAETTMAEAIRKQVEEYLVSKTRT